MNNHILRTVIVALTVISFKACKQESKNLTDKFGENITSQIQIKNQHTKQDSAVKYSFFLPKSYDGKAKLPVLFLIDPHGNVDEPIKKYATLANNYGYLFVGSEDLKNGVSAGESQKIVNALLHEIKTRFVIDENRVFISGFSGGAKLAINFAQQKSEIIGVIACGGTVPMMVSQKPNYYFTGVVGNKDFNYLEVQQTYSVFDQQGYDFTSIIFDGAHEWPSIESFDMALASMDIYAMKTKRMSKNEKWISQFYQRISDSVNTQTNRNEWLLAHQTVTQGLRWFNGLTSLKELNKKAVEIRQNPTLGSEMKQTQSLIKKEVKLRSAFIKAIQTQDLNWWKTEVDKINTTITSGNKLQSQISQRLLNYLSMACFMLSKTDLDDAKLDDAIKKIQIYEMVDPENPDVYLMYARFHMLNGDTEKMNEFYQKAKSMGFTNEAIYAKDHSWKALMERI